MPLIDPVTMSSAAMASRPTANAKVNEVIDQPTPTNPTTLAHQATYLIPALQLAFFVARFNALVADPVNTMIMSLPVVSTLQAAYVTLCLPPAGSRGTPKPAKKVNRADRKKPVAKDITIPPSPLTTGNISLILTAFAAIGLHVVIILFGGPALDHIQQTFLLAANIAILAFFPLFYIYGVDGDAWIAIATAAMPLDDSYGGLLGSVVGAWLGAVPIPLDWDREWQKWPITILCGLYGGYVLGKLIGGTVAYGRRFGAQKTGGA